MDFLYQQVPKEGYPIAVFYLVALIGISLALVRPFGAFLFSVFCLAGKNFNAAIYTRTDFTGEFLNLNDLLLWIAVLALLINTIRAGGKILLPKIILAIIAVLLIGAVQSIVEYGPDEFVLRSIWSAAIFPILFIVAVNMLRTEDEARLFYWALFAGAVIASVQHVFFLSAVSTEGISEGAPLRTISYITSGGFFLLAVALFSKLPKKGYWVPWVYYPGIVLIAISAVMNQTRQLYVVFVVTIVAIFFLLRRYVDIKKTVAKLVMIVCGVVFVVGVAFVNWDLVGIVGQRVEFLQDEKIFEESYLTRAIGMQTELNLWLDSTIVFGTGAAYPPELTEPSRQHAVGVGYQIGALDHVAITSYLAHYGLVGALLYLIFLPLLTIRYIKALLTKDFSGYVTKVALLAIVVAFMDIFNLFGSMLNTAPSSHITALIYGAAWGLYMDKKQDINNALHYSAGEPL